MLISQRLPHFGRFSWWENLQELAAFGTKVMNCCPWSRDSWRWELIGMMKICWEIDRNGGLTCDFGGLKSCNLYCDFPHGDRHFGCLFSGQSPIMMGRAAACDSGKTFDDWNVAVSTVSMTQCRQCSLRNEVPCFQKLGTRRSPSHHGHPEGSKIWASLGATQILIYDVWSFQMLIPFSPKLMSLHHQSYQSCITCCRIGEEIEGHRFGSWSAYVAGPREGHQHRYPDDHRSAWFVRPLQRLRDQKGAGAPGQGMFWVTLSRIGGQRNAKNSSMLGWRKDLQLTGSTMLILEDGPEDGCFFSVLARFSIPDIRLLHGRSLFREEIKGCANFRVHCISFPTACSGTAWYCRWLMVSIFNGHFRNLNWRYLLYIRPM